MDALKTFPKQDLVLKTEKGEAVFVKMDIFKNHLWYTYKEERFKWFRLNLEQVLEIVELNKNNEKSISLEEYESEMEIPSKIDFEDTVGQDSLTRFDVPKTRSKRHKRNRRNNRNKNKKKSLASSVNTAQQKSNQRRNSLPYTSWPRFNSPLRTELRDPAATSMMLRWLPPAHLG